MTKEDIKKIDIKKFNTLNSKYVKIKNWKEEFKEKAKCKVHP